MSKDNPCPGMNPFLESFWPDVHTKLIAYIADEISGHLPSGLKARAEENISLAGLEDETRNVRADVAVVESWRRGVPPSWQPGAEIEAEGGVVATTPEYIITSEETERWLEISDANGRLITVIEVLSPTNKNEGRERYISKRRDYLSGGVNVVEIDLLRGGRHTVAVPFGSLRRKDGVFYLTCVTRATNLERKEVYQTPLRSVLPNIRIPLRATDADVVLPLQPLVNRCYRTGAYWQESCEHIPGPPLGAEDEGWVRSMVKA
jgi:hypothetical protein